MKVPQTVLLCGMALACTTANAQPDFQLHATPLKPAPADPAISYALQAIKPSQIHQTIDQLVSFGTRNTLSSMEADLPPSQGINAAADWIVAQYDAISGECGRCLEVKRDTFIADPASGGPWAGRIPKPTKITNVYAILRGTDSAQSRRIVLVTGHYDSRNLNVLDDHGTAPGANDDASGVAVSLECARALSKMKFPATIVFAAVAGEEQGLVGSGHLAKLAKDEAWHLEAVLNNDIVGGNTTPGDTMQLKDRVRVFSEGVPVAATPEEERRIRALGKEDDSPSRELARAIEETARTYFPGSGTVKSFSAFLVSRPDRYLRGGDHSSFNHEGFAAVRFTEWREDYNHQHQNVTKPVSASEGPVLGDLIQFVDFNYVAQVARLNAATLATLASAPGEPQKLTIVNKSLENGTTLTWDPPAGGVVAHYEVLWRETTASNWQFVKQVAATSSEGQITVTLPVSKDNVAFGVRAVDAKGHRGLVVVP